MLAMMGSEVAVWWPLLFMFLFVMAMGRMTRRRGCRGINWWRDGYPNRYYDQPPYTESQPPPSIPQRQMPTVDPVEIVRERYARGEIDHEEMDKYLERLLRSDKKRDAGV